jgi:hypothetical protein
LPIAKPKPRKGRRKRPGPKPSITLAVVKRVSERFGRGLTLEQSLAAEEVSTINLETWKKCLQAHPEFSPHYEAAKGKFLDVATRRLAEAQDLKFLTWLLERRYSKMFARPAENDITVNATANATAGIPADLVERARAVVEGDQAKGQSPKSKVPKHEE